MEGLKMPDSCMNFRCCNLFFFSVFVHSKEEEVAQGLAVLGGLC